MEKAFDRCSWEFILEGLDAIGFDNAFVKTTSASLTHTSRLGDPDPLDPSEGIRVREGTEGPAMPDP